MGLDIIPCMSFDWKYSEKAYRLQREFDGMEEDISAEYPEWWKEFGERCMEARRRGVWTRECDPMIWEMNRERRNKKLMEFCREKRVIYAETETAGGWLMGYVDDCVRMLDTYAMRSAYNSSGTNDVLRRLRLAGFYEIFGAKGQEAETWLGVDWGRALGIAEKSLEGLKKKRLDAESREYVEKQLEKAIRASRIALLNGPDLYRLLWSA